MTALPPAVTTAAHGLSLGETSRGKGYHRLSEAPAHRAQARGLTVAGVVAGLAVLVGVTLLLLSTANWHHAFIGGGIAAVGILTLCVVASIWTGER